MTTVQFKIPEQIRDEFDQAFAGENHSEVIARLMQSAIAARRKQRRRASAIDEILELRRAQAPVTDDEIAAARRADQP